MISSARRVSRISASSGMYGSFIEPVPMVPLTRLPRQLLPQQIDGIGLDQHILVEILDLIALAARIAIDALVLAAPVQVNVVIEAEPVVGPFDAAQEGFCLDLFDHLRLSFICSRELAVEKPVAQPVIHITDLAVIVDVVDLARLHPHSEVKPPHPQRSA